MSPFSLHTLPHPTVPLATLSAEAACCVIASASPYSQQGNMDGPIRILGHIFVAYQVSGFRSFNKGVIKFPVGSFW